MDMCDFRIKWHFAQIFALLKRNKRPANTINCITLTIYNYTSNEVTGAE